MFAGMLPGPVNRLIECDEEGDFEVVYSIDIVGHA